MRPIVLAILDGWGYSNNKIGNAIMAAETPTLNFIFNNYPSILIQASGKAVGMMYGEPGNSEVGHITIGAGRIIFQALSRINKSIEDSSFFSNPALLGAFEHVKINNSALHLAGLISTASIHSYFSHILALLDMAAKNNVKEIFLHLYMDGKDSSLKGGSDIYFRLQDYLNEVHQGKVATFIGRDYSMDRNKNWDRTKAAYDLMVYGTGIKTDDPGMKLKEYYGQGYVDSDIPPTIVDPTGVVKSKDAVIFFNFREDSMRQMVRPFIDDGFDLFEHADHKGLYVAAMTQYFDMPRLKSVLPSERIMNSLAEVISGYGKTHLHISETEKYAHTTYFFNGLTDQPFPGETDILVDSNKNALDDPSMKAEEITAKAIRGIEEDKFDFIVMNYANADTLAHTGNLEVAVKGVEAVDRCLNNLYKSVVAQDGILIITSDHGHAEHMISKQRGDIVTGHALNPVLLYLVAKDYERKRMDYETNYSLSQSRGILSDIAPTILEIIGIPKPPEMTGNSLLKALVLK